MFYSFQGHYPQVEPGVYIAPGARLAGQVKVKSGSSIWFNAVLRGDIDRIEIGYESNIQDNSVLHPDGGYPLIVGNRVTVGHGVILHGCSIGDRALIGLGARVLTGAVIGEDAVVAAGTLVPPGKTIPARSLAVGSPAKVVRVLSDQELEEYQKLYVVYRERAILYMNEPQG